MIMPLLMSTIFEKIQETSTRKSVFHKYLEIPIKRLQQLKVNISLKKMLKRLLFYKK